MLRQPNTIELTVYAGSLLTWMTLLFLALFLLPSVAH